MCNTFFSWPFKDLKPPKEDLNGVRTARGLSPGRSFSLGETQKSFTWRVKTTEEMTQVQILLAVCLSPIIMRSSISSFFHHLHHDLRQNAFNLMVHSKNKSRQGSVLHRIASKRVISAASNNIRDRQIGFYSI